MTDQQKLQTQTHDRMGERLAELKRDHANGQRQLQRLMQQEATMRDGLLRVSGAIQVLEELLGDNAHAADGTIRPDRAPDATPSPTPNGDRTRPTSVP
ncbi:hypothetical protein ACIGDI_39880 [Streptomyces sp. NPDC085900]|uniref:hypothetical protein n=1 Tax=Streptomyces sp. NPDC085900 TaxID=3365737 RepID=UPI0037D4AE75